VYSTTPPTGAPQQVQPWIYGSILASPSRGKFVIPDDGYGFLQLWQEETEGWTHLGAVSPPIHAIVFDTAEIGYVLAQDGVHSFSTSVPDDENPAPPLLIKSNADKLMGADDLDVDYSRGLATNNQCVFFTSNKGLEWATTDETKSGQLLSSDKLLGLTLGTFQKHPAIYVAHYASADDNGGIYAVPLPKECGGT
jgi:hypothetical protein